MPQIVQNEDIQRYMKQGKNHYIATHMISIKQQNNCVCSYLVTSMRCNYKIYKTNVGCGRYYQRISVLSIILSVRFSLNRKYEACILVAQFMFLQSSNNQNERRIGNITEKIKEKVYYLL